MPDAVGEFLARSDWEFRYRDGFWVRRGWNLLAQPVVPVLWPSPQRMHDGLQGCCSAGLVVPQVVQRGVGGRFGQTSLL